MHLVSKACIFSFRVSKQGTCFTAVEDNGGDNRLVELKLACKANGVDRQVLFSLAIAEAILMWTFAEQVPSLHRVAKHVLWLKGTKHAHWPRGAKHAQDSKVRSRHIDPKVLNMYPDVKAITMHTKSRALTMHTNSRALTMHTNSKGANHAY